MLVDEPPDAQPSWGATGAGAFERSVFEKSTGWRKGTGRERKAGIHSEESDGSLESIPHQSSTVHQRAATAGKAFAVIDKGLEITDNAVKR